MADAPAVPVSLRAVVRQIWTLTDQFCAEPLDAEYADLCRRLTAKLARLQPSPLVKGEPLIWAAGVLYAVGRANFLIRCGDERGSAPRWLRKCTICRSLRRR